MTEPIHIISLGAGVQSSTMALMAAAGEITPMPKCAIFADTKAEPKSVYVWLDWLKNQLPFKVHKVSKGSLTSSALRMLVTKNGFKYSRTDIPFFTLDPKDNSGGKIRQRGCTRDFKIGPIVKKCRSIVGKKTMKEWRQRHKAALKLLAAWKKEDVLDRREKRKLTISYPHAAWQECQSDALVIQWIGISLDEVTRMKASRDPWIRHIWPLIDKGMKRHDCLLWMQKRNYPKPPRSACVYCPFHNDQEWRRLRDQEPREFRRAVLFERAIQKNKADTENMRAVPFLHRSLVPLDKVDLSTEEDRGQGNLFQNECEGMCGV